jgi:beta-galactosidase
LRDPSGLRALLREVLDHAGVRGFAGVPEDVEVVRRGAHLFLINHADRQVTVPGVTGTGLLDGVEHRGSATVPPGGVAVVRT